MKIKLSCLILAFVCALGVASAFGQAKEISEAEFNAVYKVGYGTLEGASYRLKRTFIRPRDGTPPDAEYMESEVSEFMPPDRNRTVVILRTAEGRKRTETIEVGKRKFTRLNGGAWSEEKDRDLNRYSIFGDPVGKKETKIFRNIGPTRLGNKDVDVYEGLTTSEYHFKTGPTTVESFQRVWITKDGRFVKTESRFTNNGILIDHTVSEYEYDRSIRINIPIK